MSQGTIGMFLFLSLYSVLSKRVGPHPLERADQLPGLYWQNDTVLPPCIQPCGGCTREVIEPDGGTYKCPMLLTWGWIYTL